MVALVQGGQFDVCRQIAALAENCRGTINRKSRGRVGLGEGVPSSTCLRWISISPSKRQLRGFLCLLWAANGAFRTSGVLLPTVNSIIRQNVLTGDLFKCHAKQHGWEREVENQRAARSKLWLCNSNGMSSSALKVVHLKTFLLTFFLTSICLQINFHKLSIGGKLIM